MALIDDTSLKDLPFGVLCDICKHVNFDKNKSCKAFDNIPEDIWTGKVKHTTIIKGQKGKFIFEKEDEDE